MGNATQILPPPYKGQNDQFPTISIQNPYCERMTNFNNFDGALELRQGNDLFATTGPGVGGLSYLALDSYPASTPLLFQLVMDNGGADELVWYDITSGTPSAVLTLVTTTASEVFTLFYQNYLFYFGNGDLAVGGAAGPQRYNGSAWGAAGWTYPSGFNPYGGDVYKNRAYLIDQDEAAYGYSPIDSPASGAITRIDLSGIVTGKCVLRMIRPISMTQNLTPDVVQAFIFSSGEILVYSGSFPDSANWAAISRFVISEPLFQNSYAEAKGDTIIFTKTEILSLRNLFVSGYEAERESGIGTAIQNRWRQIVAGIGAVSTGLYRDIRAVYDEKENRLVIALPLYIDPSSGSLGGARRLAQLIYDFSLGAWYEYYSEETTGSGIAGRTVAYHVEDVYVGANILPISGSASSCYTVKLEGGSNHVDDQLDGSGTNAINYQLITAPLPIPKFGVNAITGVETIMESDLYPQTNYSLIADLGKQETEAQPLPAQGTGIQKPMYNVGIQNATCVQLEISGASVSASIGLVIHAFNVWYNPSADGAR